MKLEDVPGLEIVAQRYVEAARLTNPAARLVAVSLSTSSLSPRERERMIQETSVAMAVPCFDTLASGADDVLEFLLEVPA